jgi:hypothetical protein
MMIKRLYWYIFLGFIAAYIALVFGVAPSPEVLERYHISSTAARLLNLTVVVPLVVIWITAFFGASKMKEYATAVQDSKEGPSFNALAAGLMISVMSFPLNSAISSALSHLARHNPHLLATTTIIRNYLALGLALIAFYFIGKGAMSLAKMVRKRTPGFHSEVWAVVVIAISCIFTWLIISQHPSGNAQAYFLPNWLVVTTIAIPYLYIWYRGALAAYSIYYYHQKVKGSLYKRALIYCAAGIATVIATSVLIQFILVFAERINRLDLTPILLIIYFLILLYAVGYGLIAKGAKKLKTLEEI